MKTATSQVLHMMHKSITSMGTMPGEKKWHVTYDILKLRVSRSSALVFLTPFALKDQRFSPLI